MSPSRTVRSFPTLLQAFFIIIRKIPLLRNIWKSCFAFSEVSPYIAAIQEPECQVIWIFPCDISSTSCGFSPTTTLKINLGCFFLPFPLALRTQFPNLVPLSPAIPFVLVDKEGKFKWKLVWLFDSLQKLPRHCTFLDYVYTLSFGKKEEENRLENRDLSYVHMQ